MSFAEDVIEGVFCQGCGEYIDDLIPNYPRYCSEACEEEYAPVEPE